MAASYRTLYNFLYSPLRSHEFKCVYCGEPAACRDHVFPISKVVKGDRIVGVLSELFLTVPCCTECNLLAGDYAPECFDDKLAHIREKLLNRYAKLLRRPEWTEDELKDMAPKFRESIKLDQFTKSLVAYRLEYEAGRVAVAEHATDRTTGRAIVEEIEGEAALIPCRSHQGSQRETVEVWRDVPRGSVEGHAQAGAGIESGVSGSLECDPVGLLGTASGITEA